MLASACFSTVASLDDEAGRVAALTRYQVLDTAEEEAFDRITRLAKRAMRAPMAGIALVDDRRRWFKSVAGGKRGELPRQISFCNYTIRQRTPLQVPNTLEDPRFRDNQLVVSGPQIRAYLGAPLSTPDGYLIGSMCCVDTAPREFAAEEVEMMRDFSNLVIDQLEMRRLALYDALTGVLSRRGFLQEAEKQLAVAQRYQRPFSLLAIDIDRFKGINDTYGHPVGDVALQRVGEILEAGARDCDFAGRLGGEEFAIGLPETDARQALALAERVRRLIGETPIDTPAGPLSITVSVGLASTEAATRTLEDLIGAADQGLYEAKRGGRNRCVPVG